MVARIICHLVHLFGSHQSTRVAGFHASWSLCPRPGTCYFAPNICSSLPKLCSQCSLTGHLNRGVDGVFELVCVVGHGLVAIAEVHAIVAGARLAHSEPEMARNRLAFWSVMNTPRRCHRGIQSVLRTAARYEFVPAIFGAGVVSLQLMKRLAMSRTIKHMNPPATVPHVTGADT